MALRAEQFHVLLGAALLARQTVVLRQLAALEGPAAIDEWIGQFALALRTATFLSGVTRSRDLSRRAPVVTGDTREWIAQLGYDRRPRSAK